MEGLCVSCFIPSVSMYKSHLLNHYPKKENKARPLEFGKTRVEDLEGICVGGGSKGGGILDDKGEKQFPQKKEMRTDTIPTPEHTGFSGAGVPYQ